MAEVLYVDDLIVGRKFATGSVTLTREGCTTFAREFDPQPFHLGDQAARQSLFRRLAASGWYTASLSMHLLVERRAQGRGRAYRPRR